MIHGSVQIKETLNPWVIEARSVKDVYHLGCSAHTIPPSFALNGEDKSLLLWSALLFQERRRESVKEPD